MSDRFGLLSLPWTGTVDPGKQPAGDPLLHVVLGYMQAVINADLRDLWVRIMPSEPLPVSMGCTLWHNPDPTDFNTKRTPALYVWRAKSANNRVRYSQDYTSDETPVQCLWVPPPMTQDMMRRAQPFANALKKCVEDAFVMGRHPAWKVPGDTYYDPDTYGSVLLKHAGCSKLDVTEFGPFELVIETFEQKPTKTSFDCLAWKLDVLELLQRDPTRRRAIAADQHSNRFLLGDDPTNRLEVQRAVYQVAIDGLAPSVGNPTGGELVTITGKQFAEGMTVLFGTTAGTDVTLVDESTLTVRTPAHAPGGVDVAVIAPTNSVVVPNGFTFS